MKKVIAFLVFITSLNIFSQENITIKGKLFFSKDFYWTFNNLLVKIDNSDEYIKIKENGEFEIETTTKKENYKLNFYYGSLKFKEFIYKYEWTKRDRPKSISLADKCEVNKSMISKSYLKSKKWRIYIFNRLDSLILSKKDLKFQKKNKIKYIKISTDSINKYDCYLDYNITTFKYLNHFIKGDFHKEIRKDVIGYNYRFN